MLLALLKNYRGGVEQLELRSASCWSLKMQAQDENLAFMEYEGHEQQKV